jgi:hypothetical protein
LETTTTSQQAQRIAGVAVLVATGPLLLATSPGRAQESTTQFELTPYMSYRAGGTFEDEVSTATVDLEEGGAFGLALNIRESANTQWEIVYAQQDTTADTSELDGFAPSTDLRVQYLHGGGHYEFERRGSTRPYLVATAGATHVSPRLAGFDSDSFWSFSIGTGLNVRATERIGARFEARVWGTLVDPDSRLFCFSGAQAAACQIQVDGKILYQVDLSAGLTIRF